MPHRTGVDSLGSPSAVWGTDSAVNSKPVYVADVETPDPVCRLPACDTTPGVYLGTLETVEKPAVHLDDGTRRSVRAATHVPPPSVDQPALAFDRTNSRIVAVYPHHHVVRRLRGDAGGRRRSASSRRQPAAAPGRPRR